MKRGTPEAPSGRFVLRIGPGLHAALRAAAIESELSLNEYCARKLAVPVANVSGPATSVVERAAELAGTSLVAVTAFGSWARGELTESSDVDLLIVLDHTTPISRGLYREWDRSPMSWDHHLVEPHFVHLPAPDAPVSSVWAEVAVDGVILFDRDLVVSRLLVRIRQDIAAGRIVRRVIHGQPYWVEAA